MTSVSVVSTVGRVVATARERHLSFLAASLAYYMVVSLFPLAVLALVVATAVGGPPVADRVVAAFGTVLSADAAAVLRDALVNAEGRAGVTVFGVLLLLWSGLRVFRGLDVAFSLVYDNPETGSFLDQVRDALVALAAIAVAVAAIALAAVATSPLLGSGRSSRVVALLGPLALAGSLALVFFPVYYVFPDLDVTVREVLPGTVLAAVGWTALGAAFTLYASVAGSYELYGVAGGLLLLVTWFYAASLFLLLGAVTNAVLAGRIGRDRHLQLATARTVETMTGADGDEGTTPPPDDGDAADARATVESESGDRTDDADREVDDLRAELDDLRDRVEDRTLHRDDVEGDLRRYVRRRVRRGHARGWGPYLVLLYGTAMTIGAFVELTGPWAVLAMVVIWLSTLGLYTLMVLVGVGLSASALPRRAVDRVRDR